MNTTRQALFLPVSRDAKYDGKTAIDTFFWRFGDLIQAGVVYAGLHRGTGRLAVRDANLAASRSVWLAIAIRIGREYMRMGRENVTNVAPEATKPIEDLLYDPGSHSGTSSPAIASATTTPGRRPAPDARLADGSPLPRWDALRHAPPHLQRRRSPPTCRRSSPSVVVASDVDGMEASSCFRKSGGSRRSGPESSSTRGFAGSFQQGIAPCQQRDARRDSAAGAPRPRERLSHPAVAGDRTDRARIGEHWLAGEAAMLARAESRRVR